MQPPEREDPSYLDETSFVVLAMIERLGPMTVQEVKLNVRSTLCDFWPSQHVYLPGEPARLARGGYLEGTRVRPEGSQKPGKTKWALTQRGREALAALRREPPVDLPELRDHGITKLHLGGEPAVVAEAQRRVHAERLARFERRLAEMQDGGEGPRLALEVQIRYARAAVEAWTEVAERDG